MIYISSDHGGFELKNKIVKFLESKNHEVKDMGPPKHDPEDDYPDFVMPVVMNVLDDRENNKGILLCRNGVGVSMFANKFKGVRCCLSWDSKHAKSCKTDDDTNILALPADYLDEKQAFEIVETWLNEKFGEEERHKRRLRKVEDVERVFKEIC